LVEERRLMGAREFRVGVFVMLALLIGGGIVFTIGSETRLFADTTTYTVIFDETSGLRPGSPVQIAGVPVGAVKTVEFTESGRIRVRFDLVSEKPRLIRGNPSDEHPEEAESDEAQGSIVSVEGEGMLGDMLLNISVGDPSLPKWPAEVPLPTSRGGTIMDAAAAAMEEIKATAENLNEVTEPLSKKAFTDDISETADHLAAVTGMLAEGNGTLQ